MKKLTAILIVFTIFSLFSVNINAQNQEEGLSVQPKNEIKVNLPYLLGTTLDIGYERVINENSGLGASIIIPIGDDFDFGFIAIPYYRFYFGNKYAAGFFIEANAGFFSSEQYDTKYTPDGHITTSDNELKFGLGFAVGHKYEKNNWVGDIYFGMGRALNGDGIYPRAGITIGKRF